MYIDYLLADNEVRTRISECGGAGGLAAPALDFQREDYYRDVMCRPVNFPTARFRDWLKRYNVDIEITDPDGQTVSQTTFAPAAATTLTHCSEPGWCSHTRSAETYHISHIFCSKYIKTSKHWCTLTERGVPGYL